MAEQAEARRGVDPEPEAAFRRGYKAGFKVCLRAAAAMWRGGMRPAAVFDVLDMHLRGPLAHWERYEFHGQQVRPPLIGALNVHGRPAGQLDWRPDGR